MPEVAVQYLVQVLAIAFGAALGSVIRHTADTRGHAVLGGMTPRRQLAMSAAGSFVVGFFAVHFAHFGVSAPGSERPLLSSIIGIFLVGVVGGFVTFPAFTRDNSAPNPDAEAAKVVFTVVSSLVATITFFFVGAFCARMTAA
jgi:fluoride ion exporter CrcB/FEX